MDWEYVRISGLILVLMALGTALLWGLGFAVYLNRSGSRGWASTRRLLTTSLWVFAVALPVAFGIKEGATLWTLTRGHLGSAEGQYQTGLLYLGNDTFLRSNPTKAVAAFRQAANQGHAQAQFALAQACASGLGTAKNSAEALRWARAAAQAGQPLAMVLAGELLQASSPAEAEALFRRAAPLLRAQGESGDAGACFALGHLHRSGLGVAQDPEEALYWMLLGRRLGIGPLHEFMVQEQEKSLTPEQQTRAHARAEAWIRSKTKT